MSLKPALVVVDVFGRAQDSKVCALQSRDLKEPVLREPVAATSVGVVAGNELALSLQALE